jgi:predicted DCC family thiol-disulfide oxidoreductase YuxK
MTPELVFLHDGRCRLCVRGSRLMGRLAARGRLELRDFQQPEALAPFPQVTHAQCMQAAQLVTRDGRAWSGLEAVVRALRTRAGSTSGWPPTATRSWAASRPRPPRTPRR